MGEMCFQSVYIYLANVCGATDIKVERPFKPRSTSEITMSMFESLRLARPVAVMSLH